MGKRKKLINGNGFVFGVSGSGKSFFCKMEMGSVFLSGNDEIIVIDPQNEYFDIAKTYGGKIAVVYVVFGLVIAVAGGTFIEKMHLENYVEDFVRNASAVDIDSPTLTQKERLEYAKDQVVSTFKKVFPYILVGVGIGALIHNWIPETMVETVLGSQNQWGVIRNSGAFHNFVSTQNLFFCVSAFFPGNAMAVKESFILILDSRHIRYESIESFYFGQNGCSRTAFTGS